MTLCGRSWIPALRMRKGAENGRHLAWLRTARTLPGAGLSPVLLAGFSATLLPVVRPGPGDPAPHCSSVLLGRCALGQVSGASGGSGWPGSGPPPQGRLGPAVTVEDPQVMGRPVAAEAAAPQPVPRTARLRAALLLTCLCFFSPPCYGSGAPC